jgi:hypothetical protein
VEGTSVNLDVVFAYLVGVLAGLAVIGLLAFVLVWEWCAIRRILAAHRHPASHGMPRERGALMPTNPAEREPIDEAADRMLAGDPLRGIALDWRRRGRHGQQQP